MRCPSGLPALRRDHLLAQMMPKAKPLPPLELVEQLLDYDPETGVFYWKQRRGGKAKKGSLAGAVGANGYLYVRIEKRQLLAHRLAWLLLTNADPGELQIDHMNGNRLDNTSSNLRIATCNQNSCNRGAQVNNKSGFKGVWYSKKQSRWVSEIWSKGEKTYLGSFDTPELAHMAYCKAAAELHGDFARAA